MFIFLRIKLTPRSKESKIVLRGIFPGAIVQRGHDWKWGNQDGGESKKAQIVMFVISFVKHFHVDILFGILRFYGHSNGYNLLGK